MTSLSISRTTTHLSACQSVFVVFSEIALYALDVYYNQTYLNQSSKLKTINQQQQMFLKVTNNLELTGKEIFNSWETLSLS